MAKYHVNPETGNPNVCRAKLSCPYGGDEKHFEGNKNEARKWAEEVNAEQHGDGSSFGSKKKKTSTTRLNRDAYHKYNYYDSFEVEHNGQKYNVETYKKSWNTDYDLVSWMLDKDDNIIGMTHFFLPTENYGNHAVLCDIETHPDMRGQGFAKTMVKSLSDKYGQLHTSGSYSVSGHKALGDHVPLLPGADVAVDKRTEEYEFVNWERGQSYRV